MHSEACRIQLLGLRVDIGGGPGGRVDLNAATAQVKREARKAEQQQRQKSKGVHKAILDGDWAEVKKSAGFRAGGSGFSSSGRVEVASRHLISSIRLMVNLLHKVDRR